MAGELIICDIVAPMKINAPDCSSLLYSSADAQLAATRRGIGAVRLPPEPILNDFDASDSNSYQTFRIVDEAVGKGIRETLNEKEIQSGMQEKPVSFSSALSKALCRQQLGHKISWRSDIIFTRLHRHQSAI